MARIILLVLCIFLSLADGAQAASTSARTATATLSGHTPRYKSYKHRGQTRKRNQRRSFFHRIFHRKGTKVKTPAKPRVKKGRGVIEVGDLKGTMPSQ